MLYSIYQNILHRAWTVGCICLVLVTAPGLAAQSFSEGGLQIQVKRTAASAPGYTTFEIIAENPTAEDRTLRASIQLTWADPTKPEGPPKSESSCIAILEIPAGHRLTEIVPCKGLEFTKYEFQIQSVLPYILEKSPLNWQKAEALAPEPEPAPQKEEQAPAEQEPAEPAEPAGENKTSE